MNNLNANSVTTQALISFTQIKHILMSGIAGGCPNRRSRRRHVRLGDHRGADYRGIVQYDHVKATLEQGEEGFASHAATRMEPSAVMLQAATQLDTGRPWRSVLGRPGFAKGMCGL